MPERSAEEIRREIAAERKALAEDLDGLRGEALSLAPLVAGGLISIVLLWRIRYLKTAGRLLRIFR